MEATRTGHDRGRNFIHPELRFRFSVPDGSSSSTTYARIASGPEGAMIQLNLDLNPTKAIWIIIYKMCGQANTPVVSRENHRQWNERRHRAVQIAGEMASLTYALLLFSNTADEFFASCFLLPEADKTARNGLQRTTFSLHTISAWEAAATRPWRLKIRPVQAGDTVARLSRQMAVNNFKEETFRVLNGLRPGDRLRAGQLVKVVAD